jgi:hypothetical protein
MRTVRRRGIQLAASVSLAALAAAAAAGEPAKFLPEGSLRMMGARYAPAERDFQWDAWVGGELGLLRWAGTTFLVAVEVETILGNELRAFDANQANYHVEGALKRPWARRTVELFFSHVSRHTEDRPKPQTVDWNILGLRLSGPLGHTPFPTRFLVSAGPTTRSSLVEYRFEVIGGLEADLVAKPWGAVYLSAMLRGVKTESKLALPRSGFLDVNVEGGARVRRGQRSFHVFAAYERRNDVYPLLPELRNRLLMGLRFGINDRSE